MPSRASAVVLDRYSASREPVLLTGIQALVRLPLEQRRLDRIAGLDTAGFISGYEGSPLGGYDLEIQRNRELFAAHQVLHRPGVNEDLAATAVAATQQVPQLAGSTVGGVAGIWYGKAPGLDRSVDAIRHANLMGTHPSGGVLALVGDDPSCKSSTVPSASEMTLASMGLPVLAPRDSEQALVLGLHGIALSRASGLWASLKVVTNVADGYGLLTPPDLDDFLSALPSLEPHGHRVGIRNDGEGRREMERSAFEVRLPIAAQYIREAGLNRMTSISSMDRIGIICGGRTVAEVHAALERLGVDPRKREQLGIRFLELGALYPIPAEDITDFAQGLRAILVVEEKRPFVEPMVKEVLYGRTEAPAVVGARDAEGRSLIPTDGELTADRLLAPLHRWLSSFVELPQRPSAATPMVRTQLPVLSRPNFTCSGCPHNTSLAVPAGAQVGIGIGCHALVTQLPAERVGELITKTHMGGEGAQWIGISPFMDDEHDHLFQNVGDGTFAHSGSLAVRAAVAAQIPITFKLLVNSAVAMTGGQSIAGEMTVPQVTRLLAAEGVDETVVVTDGTHAYRARDLAANASLADRADLLSVQERLRRRGGVTVLIYDQECATELRRKRKRGKAPKPTTRVVINERVCEGCGDCGRASACLSVEPVETPLGRKTRINQGSCNIDLSCLQGDCPAFATVDVPPSGGERPDVERWRMLPEAHAGLPEITAAPAQWPYRVRVAGIGGTGVITLAQVLARAGQVSGLHVGGIDQTGLAQKGGAVASDLVFSDRPLEGSASIGRGRADLLLGCDLLVAASPTGLSGVGPGTVVVASSALVPTGTAVTDVETPSIDRSALLELLDEHSGGTLTAVDARHAAEHLFGTDALANTILVGLALQQGALPLNPTRVEDAYRANGVDVERNIAALRWGRALAADPVLRDSICGPQDAAERPSEAWFVQELARYQDGRYAARFSRELDELKRSLREIGIDDRGVEAEIAANLFKLMAYKDEYEVARLWLLPEVDEQITRQAPGGSRRRILLHPPALKAVGLKRKIGFGRSGRPMLRVLAASKRLRGTPLDPFGHTSMRRTERALAGEYLDYLRQAIDCRPDPARLLEVVRLPERIRGYEALKLAGIAEYRQEMGERLTAIRHPDNASPTNGSGARTNHQETTC